MIASLKEEVIQQLRSTVGVKRSTKERLDGYGARGQTHEGLILEMLDLWKEEVGGDRWARRRKEVMPM